MKKITKAAAAVMLTMVMVFVVGCTPEVSPLDVSGSGSYNGYEYVDLGLPSGTLWATCNVGATTPTEYGDYFAWGETMPKATYNWGTYKYCNNGDYQQITKYCNNPSDGYNGFSDNLIALLPEDDVATANWGSGWCMPTTDQWVELLNNTAAAWFILDGVEGRLFTAVNGNRLFLPAAGTRSGSELHEAGSYGYYWSNSLYTGFSNFAWCIYFYLKYDDKDYFYRSSGYSVRPVRASH